MVALLRKTERVDRIGASEHGLKLKELIDSAAEIRELHQNGKISAEEAQARLADLKRRNRRFIDLFLE